MGQTSEQVDPIGGLHHVTAIAGDPQRNLDFYTTVLGLRLVKKTVNFGDPTSYHFYFADPEGRPGTILTFFAWPAAARGRHGPGQATLTSFAVPEGALGFWKERLETHGIACQASEQRFGEEALVFLDPDGLRLELVARSGAGGGTAWTRSVIPESYAVGGLYGVTLTEAQARTTADFLTATLGFRLLEERGDCLRFEVGQGEARARVDVVDAPGASPGTTAVGTVHHVAWRVACNDAQLKWQRRLRDGGLGVTQVRDRKYFHSIYFREPGSVLFEIATDGPGFAVDESLEGLGSALKLPAWLEPDRARIEDHLPKLR